MADYHSLLSRAVANLPKPSTPAARKAIYDRARAALINQLRSLKPQLPESDIAREEAALDEAVARLELEHASSPPAALVKPNVSPPRPPRPPPPPPPPRVTTPRPPPAPPAAPSIRAPKPSPPPIRPAAVPAATTRAPPVSPPAPARSTPLANSGAAAPVEAPQLVAATGEPAATINATPVVSPPTRETPARKAAEESHPVVAPEIATATEPDNAPKVAPHIEPDSVVRAPARVEPEPPRPMAPSPEIARRASPLVWIGLAVAVGLIGSVAVAAFLLREKPQDLTIKDQAASAAPAATGANGQKIAQRADGGAGSTEPTPKPESTPTPIPSQTPVTDSTPAQTSSPAVASPSPQPAQASIPIAARAAMLVADGADTQKPAVSIGTVVWSPAPAVPGQPGSVGVKAEIEIPDLRMHASMVLRKNVDPGLPASHTIDFRVTFDPGSPIKGVKDIALPLMRRDDPPAADALIGVRVKINDGYYLVGLNRADADIARNVDEIGSRGWFDFPMQLSDDRIAKLTFEKAADGDRVIGDALAAWK